MTVFCIAALIHLHLIKDRSVKHRSYSQDFHIKMDSLLISPKLVSDLQHCMDIPTNLHEQLVNMVLLVQANIIMDMFQLLFYLVIFSQQLYGCLQGKGHTCKCMCIDDTICQGKRKLTRYPEL